MRREDFDRLVSDYRRARAIAGARDATDEQRKRSDSLRADLERFYRDERMSPVFPPVNMFSDYPTRCPACRAVVIKQIGDTYLELVWCACGHSWIEYSPPPDPAFAERIRALELGA